MNSYGIVYLHLHSIKYFLYNYVGNVYYSETVNIAGCGVKFDHALKFAFYCVKMEGLALKLKQVSHRWMIQSGTY